MTEMKLNYRAGMTLNKWIHQNVGEIIDSIPGSLLDNMIVYCKRGIAYIFEEYVNPNISEYHIYWMKHNVGQRPNVNAIFERWEKLEREYNDYLREIGELD